jgi:hippurate hydrolase
MAIKNRFADWHDEITAWRRDIHQHPEIRFEEHRTAGIVADKLRAFGCDEVVTGVGQTGVVGVIRGQTSGSGRVLGFRADMDALPMQEETGLPHASQNAGAMHACGHDGHTAMLLGAARYLAETRNFDGTVVLLFQPAEEGGGGARAMVEEGVLDRFEIDEVYGMHNWPGLAPGQFATRAGPLMGAVDFFDLTVTGKGAHGAMPHLSVDPAPAAASIVLALQTIASRNAEPLSTVVVTVGGIQSHPDAYNVIPQRIELKGTTRYVTPEDGEMIRTRMQTICDSIATAHGCTATLNNMILVPPTVNHDVETGYAAEAARSVAGEVITDQPPTLAGEDFAEMLNARPGAYMFIGNGDSADLHNTKYDFKDDAIPAGCSWFAELAETRMPLGG